MVGIPEGHRFSLHFHITTLFTIIIVICGLLISWFSYKELSTLMLSSGKLIFSESSKQVDKKLSSENHNITMMLKIVASSKLIETNNAQERLASITVLKAMLDSTNSLKALFIAYANNDFLLFRKIKAGEYSQKYGASNQSRYMLTMRTQNSTHHYFYNQALQSQFKVSDPDYQLDAKSRPWYQQATQSQGVISTGAYVFYSSQELGITHASIDNINNAVIGADYTLSDLSAILNGFNKTANSQRIVLNKSGQVLAYQDNQVLLSERGKFDRLKLISEINRPALQYVFTHFKDKKTSTQFNYHGQQWLAQVSTIGSNDNLYLVQLIPLDELLGEAYAMRKKATLMTLLITILSLPLAWIFSKLLTSPIRKLTRELSYIKEFDFTRPINTRTYIKEINELIEVTQGMQTTISRFQALSASLVGKQSFKQLLKKITVETISLSHAQGAMVLLTDKAKKTSVAFTNFAQTTESENIKISQQLQSMPLTEEAFEQLIIQQQNTNSGSTLPINISQLLPLSITSANSLAWRLFPLMNRKGGCIGALAVINDEKELQQQGKQNFIQAIASFSALAIEGQILLAEQKNLLESFILLIAGAIDSKSAYTGGHCERVPELTKLLSHKACSQQTGPFKDFDLTEEQWEELHIAAWLHDCGKIVTPEHVVDKATKLETIYNRIHEVRMRFELLKKQAHCDYWQGISEGLEPQLLQQQRDTLLATLDQEFTFVADCNIGGEFMSETKINRLNEIATRTWIRTLDDQLGLTPQELARYNNSQNLPATESLLSDRPEHLIKREHGELTEPGNPWHFNMKTPKYQFNRGELHNLSIKRGTLTEEDRFVVNDHMVHTIVMLSKLPFPKHLENVPLIAGGHHEKMDGTGYPRAISAKTLPVTARIMVIADIFEALTASDRPYKERKTLSQSIKIMGFMVQDKHIDEELFQLFLSSGAYLEYAQQYLHPDQIDTVDIDDYLNQNKETKEIKSKTTA